MQATEVTPVPAANVAVPVGMDRPSPTVPVTAGNVAVKALDAEADSRLTPPGAVPLASARMPVVRPDTPIVKVGEENLRLALSDGQFPEVPPNTTSAKGTAADAPIALVDVAQSNPP